MKGEKHGDYANIYIYIKRSKQREIKNITSKAVRESSQEKTTIKERVTKSGKLLFVPELSKNLK